MVILLYCILPHLVVRSIGITGLRSITYAPWGGGGVKAPIHLYCVLHIKRGEGVQIACKIVYVINGRPLGPNGSLFCE